jgi:hypothetical protein
MQGALEILEDILEGLEVEFRGVGLGRAHDAECCEDVGARAYGNVLKTAEEVGVDITGMTHEEIGSGMAKTGKEIGVRGHDGR